MFNAVARRESSMPWDDIIYKRKASRVLKCGSANGGDCKTQPILLNNIPEHFTYRRQLAVEQLLEEIKKRKLFGYVQCDIELPENMGATFANFPPMFKNTLVRQSDIGDLMKNYAEEERLLSRPRKIMISSFTLQNGTLYCSSAVILSIFGSCSHKNTRRCWVHSKEMLQQFCAVSSGCKKARWRKSKLKCRRRDSEASSQRHLMLPDRGMEPTHCNEVPHWQKNTCGHHL